MGDGGRSFGERFWGPDPLEEWLKRHALASSLVMGLVSGTIAAITFGDRSGPLAALTAFLFATAAGTGLMMLYRHAVGSLRVGSRDKQTWGAVVAYSLWWWLTLGIVVLTSTDPPDVIGWAAMLPFLVIFFKLVNEFWSKRARPAQQGDQARGGP